MSEAPRRGIRNQPPDPNPRRPTIAIPAGSWDCHIHLFGPAADWPFDASSPYVADDALAQDYLAMQDVLGLRYGVVVSAGGYGKDYRHIADVLARFGERLRGIILPPDDIGAGDVAALDALGVRGVRMFGGPAGHEWSHLPVLNPRIAALVHEQGWHVQYHSLVKGEIVDRVDELLALPNRIVLDHFGMVDPALGLDQPAFRALLRLLDSGRVWIKLSGPMRCDPADFPYYAMTPFANALAAHAPDRLVWGSDWPHVQMNGRLMPNDGDLIDLLARWVPDEAVRARILAETPRALYA